MASGGATGSGVNGSGMAGGGMAGSDGASGGSPGAGSGAGGGGGAAGGKMKSRRQHLGAAKPPYARSKQGIISRMTETVKNIVPAWLQKYFNKREEECADGNESANQEETPVNYHHDYADEDTIIDERFTPEPARINRQEPSTSRSALNFPVVLTRPSLHRSHLNYPMLDSPVPPCQPSTSSIFGIGSPGLSFIKEIKDSTSQQDDDNISTTSGFSSRASDKDVAVLKNTSSSLLWPTEAERTHSLSQHSAASSKKPAFSLSVFGGLCPARGSTSFCKQNQLGFSPFYPGKTAYGGAAVRSKQPKTEPYRAQKRAKARQETVRSPATLSTAARCILEAMEKLSSPLLDAKRMASLLPLYCPPDIDKLDITDFQSKRRKLESQNASQHPPVKRLVTPKVNPQSMLYARYPKPSPTATTQSSKIRQRVDTKYQGMREKTLPAEQQAEPSESNVTSYKFNTAASNGLSSGMSSGGGKMRRERGMHYLSRAVQEQEVEEPVLPKIPLPIATASLPQFNFSFVDSSAVSASPSTVSTAAMSMATPAAATGVANPAAARGVAIPAAATGVATPAAAMGMATPAAATGMATPAEAKGMGNPAEATGMDNRVAVTGIARTAGATGTGNGEAATGMENHKAAAGTGNPAAATGAGNPAVAPAAGMACPSEVEGMACPSEVEGMACPSEVEGMTDPSEVEDLTDLSEEEVEDMTYSMATAGITYSTVSSGLTYPVVAPGTPSLMMTKGKAKSTAATTSMANSTAAAGKIQPTSNVSSPEFAFSSPIVKSTEAEVLPTFSIGFTFSVPVVKSAELSGSSGTPVTSFLTLDTTTSTNTNTQKEEVEDFVGGPFTTAHVLKEGSVLDILKNPDFGFLKTHSSTSVQPTTSTVVYTRPAITTFSAGKETSKQASYWQSDTRDPFLQNKDINNKCVTCQSTKASTVESMKQTVSSSQCDTSKPAAPPAGMLGFGDKFKTVPGTWDCDTCLVQNKPEATKCIACETPKPGTGVMPALTLPVVTDSSVTVTSSSSSTDTTATLGFGDKFKKPKGSWDCGICLVSNKTEDNKCVACQSEKPEGPTPVTSSSASAFSAPSGEFLDLDKFKKPEGSWDCETCLVRNKAEATKCVACESAKPGTKAELKGFGTATASTNAALPSFTFGVQPSSSSESSHTLDSTGSFKFGEQGGFKFGIASESASSNSLVGGFKFPSTPGDFKFGVSSSLSKSEESKKEGKNNSFTFGLPSTSSQAPSTFRFGAASLGQQEKKEEPVLGGFAFGTSSATSMVANENKTGVSGFTFGTVGEKEVVSASFAFKKPDDKKEEAPSTKGGFSFGSAESVAASQFILGRTEEKQDSVTSAAPLVFGKKADTEESKTQPIFSVGKSEHTKEESTAKPIFNFSFVKPSEKEPEQAKPAFSFGVQTSTSDQGAAKPSFSFLSSGSSSTAIPTTSANSSSVFGSVTSSSNPMPVPAPFVFGQASNTVSSSTFGNSAEFTTSQSFGFSQENKPATTSSSTGVAVAPFVFGSGASSSNAANPGFTFGATTTSSSTGLSSSFVFGSGSPAPAAGPAFGASQPPAFGQSQGSSQPNTPSFGSLSTTLFSAGSQPAPPAFGSVTSSTQPPVFGQQASQQPGFGSGTSSAGPVFQFGSNTSNFNFPNNPGVFTFGANPTAPTASAQPSGSSGFSFSQPPAFTVGTNGKNIFSASGSSVSGRKIKTAVRRRK
ncbi:nuclear pore complex protein Nup153 isoform X4 [Cygnus olor]|uniref:nuclear pore complex protein Nup153 isoform X4 n=1 Tax=Cygnus olor TaxID=8869 RepID=UPI001ADE24D8|nr:nuclear pore complex protein Nup153 isoform X4 [Cygnus olor]